MTPDDPIDPRRDDTDAAAPTPSRDELASALLDGVLGDEEAAAARDRPDVVARAAAMEDARRALRDLPLPPHADRERALTAALAAYDNESAGGADRASGAAHGDAGDGTAPFARRPTRGSPPPRSRTSARRARRWLAAAAALAALAGLAGLAITAAGGDRDEDVAVPTAAEATAGGHAADGGDEADDRATSEAPMAGAESDGAAEVAADEAGDLGVFASADALVDQVTALLARDGDASRSAPLPVAPDGGAAAGFSDACAAEAPSPLTDALATVLRGRATVGERPVEVWVVDTSEGRRVVAVDDACAVVVDRPAG